MKWVSHVVSGVGAVLAVSYFIFHEPLYTSLILASTAGVLGSLLPDIHHPPMKRNAFLHSLIGAVLTPIPFVMVFCFAYYTIYDKMVPIEQVYLIYKMIVLAYLLHLFGDSLSAGGIYLCYPFKRKKTALAHIAYDDPYLNYSFIAVSVLLILVTLAIGSKELLELPFK